MKKTIIIYISIFFCVFAQEENDYTHIIEDAAEVYSFNVGNVEKRVVAHWYEDTQNLTTAVKDPVQNAFWAVSNGGFLSYPVLNLMEIGVDFEFYAKQNKDNTKILPTYIYKVFTHTSQNYDSILRGDWSFINLLAMEKSEIASKELLQYIDTTKQDSLAVYVNFVRGLDHQEKINYFDSLNINLEYQEKTICHYYESNWSSDEFKGKCIWSTTYLEYFVRTDKKNILAMINSGAVVSLSLKDKINTTAVASKKTAKNFNVAIVGRTIRFSQDLHSNSTINIYAPNGKTVYTSKITGNSHKLPDNIAKGVYILKITGSAKAVIYSAKIMF